MAASGAAATSSRQSASARKRCSWAAPTPTDLAPAADRASRGRSKSCALTSCERSSCWDARQSSRWIAPGWTYPRRGTIADGHTMKLIRFGSSGAERPGVLLEDGTRLDVSAAVADYDDAFFAGDGLQQVRAWLDQIGRASPRVAT